MVCVGNSTIFFFLISIRDWLNSWAQNPQMRNPPGQVAHWEVIPRSTARGGEPLSGLLTSHCGHRVGVGSMSTCGSIWCPVPPGPLRGGMGLILRYLHPKCEKAVGLTYQPPFAAGGGCSRPHLPNMLAKHSPRPEQASGQRRARAVSETVGAARAGGVKAGPCLVCEENGARAPGPCGLPTASTAGAGCLSVACLPFRKENC